MKISVIIPVYNGEKYIAQCIENVLCQTHKDLEVIVVNDGSTDRTAEIAAGYPTVKLLSQQNQGPSVSRNNGARAATGEWIHFMDVDDLIGRDYYERMAEAVPEGATVDMVFGGYRSHAYPDASMSFNQRMLIVALEDKIAVTNAAQFAYAWRYLIRRDFMEREGLQFEPGRLIEDMIFVLQALERAGAVATAPGAMYHYLKREGSMLNSRDKAHTLRLKTDYGLARAFRRDFFARHGLGPVFKPLATRQYKILGIPMVRKLTLNNGKTRWYLFGVRILQRKCV